MLALEREYQNILSWAEKVEAVYTEIYDQRFALEREVFSPYERERCVYVCARVVAVGNAPFVS